MKINHLESLCIIYVDFDIWSGQTRLTASDLKLGDGGEIPPEKLAQLGSKKICDPVALKGFNRLKTETRRLMLRYGMPFMNGFAIPIKKSQEICDKLNDIETQFHLLKVDFLNGYAQAVENWCQENPEYEQAIRAGALPSYVVDRKIGFEYEVFMIQPVNEDEHTEHATRLNNKIEHLGNDLISEVIQEANKFYEKNLAGRNQCAIKTKKSLIKIRDKIDGLSFLNGHLTSLVQLLDQTIHGYEQNIGGYIKAPFFYQLASAILMMTDRKKIEQYANGALSVSDINQKINDREIRKSNQDPLLPKEVVLKEQNLEEEINLFFNHFDEKENNINPVSDKDLVITKKGSLPVYSDDDCFF